ncbi:hypothetical protein F5884DRAFT_54387 [Xylogone sp. PMI_703]|nr:hypothetical protein F5884DRAFT_54387 [Xylogone sp. PMI_703]
MTTESNSSIDNADIFNQLDTYPWDKDGEFQIGLSAILGSTTSPAQIQELTLRARCFYLSRKKSTPIDFDAYKTHFLSKYPDGLPKEALERKSASPTQDRTQPRIESDANNDTVPQKDAPYPSSFAEIVALITAGKPIPGIREIPPIVLEDQATRPAASKRRKPWEKEGTGDVIDGGTFGDRRDEIIQQDIPEP